MKSIYILFLSAVFFVIMISGCKKDNPDPTPSNELTFVSLEATDTTLPVNGFVTITANVNGENLTYTWTAEYGTFIGSGKTVEWTVCHVDRFKINCEVTDASNHSVTKDIYITSHE